MSSATNSKEIPGLPRKIHQEMVTPYKMTVAVLIKCYCQFKESDEMENISVSEKVKLRKSFCILALKILQGPDLKLCELKNMFAPLDSLYPVFEKFDINLDELYTNGVGTLLDITDEIKQVLNGDPNQTDKNPLMTNNVVSKNSVIGYFLRRFIMYFEKLSFSEVSRLYQTFVRYYNDWKKCLQSTVTATDTKFEKWYVDENQWSRRQAELFLATQAALLQNDEEKALPPQELQNKISSILKSNPELAEAHFMSFLNYLRVEEFCGAMQSLFHCFDRRTNPDVKCYNDEKSKEHRYAALNLAILHHHFGHTKEALASLKEAIKIAHEANDNLCLQHALSWLYRLSNVNKDNLIVQCIIKTFELNISYTTSLALQNFAHYGSAKTSVKPSVIFETLTKSDMLNCQHNYKDLIFNNNTMKAALWRLYGKTDMCSLWSQMLLYLNIDTATHTAAHYGEGYLQAVCNTALNMLLEVSDTILDKAAEATGKLIPTKSSNRYIKEYELFCQWKQFHKVTNIQEDVLLAYFLDEGEYNLSNTLLQYAKRKYPHEPHSRTWMLVENFVNFTRALYNERWLEAESVAQKIVVLDKWEGFLKLAELCFYRQEYEEANKCLSVILQNYNYDEHLNDGKFCLLRAKILLAEIQFASSYPNVSGTILSLNNCLIDAEKSELAYQIALIHLHMANVLLSLGLTSQAVRVLNNPKCMVEILANGGSYDRSRATLLYVKCLVADSSKLDVEKRASVIRNCVKSLEKVRIGFEKVEAYSRVKDVLYLQARLYNVVHMKTERNQCALAYKQLNDDYPTKNIQTLIKYL